MIRKNDIHVPEGYFENLQERLSAIGQPNLRVEKPGVVRRFIPYAAIAASMLIAVTVGNWILSHTAGIHTQDNMYENMLVAEVLRTSDPDGYPMIDETAEDLTEEDIVNYLISSGISLEQINAARYEDFR